MAVAANHEQETQAPVKVLVIDDQAVIMGYKPFLTMLGFEVELAQSGHRGLDLAERYRPDIILLDYNMPVLNGLQVAQRLRDSDRTKNIPIIMITMNDEPDHRRQAEIVGVDDFLVKDSMTHALEDAISRIIKRKPAPPPPSVRQTQTQTIRSIGELFGKTPTDMMTALNSHPKSEWATVLLLALKSGDASLRGRAVIAVAAWQRDEDAPFRFTEGQHSFWHHVRHSLASTTIVEAEKYYSRLSPVALALMQPPHLLTSALQACMKETYWECRSWVLRILFENREMATLDLAVAGMGDDSGEVRASAAMILAEQGTTRQIPLLAQAMSDVEPGVREHAATALARIGGDLSIKVLTTVLLNSKAGAAEAAANGLSRIGTLEAIEALLEAAAIRHEPAVLRRVAHALGKMQTDDCLNALGMLAVHEDEAVRRAALLYL